MIDNEIQARLFEMQDIKYRDFVAKLTPAIDKTSIIGVRTPELRRFAKQLAGTAQANEFLKHLPHRYYEENNLHGFLIEQIKDYNDCVTETEKFLPFVDNWATCDLMSPKVFKKNTDDLLEKIRKWILSGKTYTVRFGIGMLMSFYLNEKFKPEYLEEVAAIRSDEYYVNMMIAWFFATALAKQYAASIPNLENQRLDKWVHNKAIQKAVESYRITDEQKAYLKTLKK